MRRVALVLLAFLVSQVASAQSSLYGDVNGDGVVNISDVNAVISVIFDGPPQEFDNHECVDLGLPSGTLWATMNVGANSPEEYGDYFAWGETESKQRYEWATYKFGTAMALTKYCTDSGFGTVDNLTELEPTDDAATVNWGPGWRMPSIEQMNELVAECNWQWMTVNGVNGYMLTSKHNGNSLFLPAAGCHLEGSIVAVGEDGAYWSRTLESSFPCDAGYLVLHSSGYVYYCAIYDRNIGQSVRPVRANRK